MTTVDVDNVGAGRLAAQRLLDGGRRRLGMVAGPAGSWAAVDREEGFREAAEMTHLARGDGTAAGGAQGMRRLLTEAPDLDGVFVADDLMALGALHALTAAGRRVPRHVAVVGFGDVDLAATSAPPLTTIRAPRAAQARRMVELLVQRIAGRDVPPSVVLEVELVARDSG